MVRRHRGVVVQPVVGTVHNRVHRKNQQAKVRCVTVVTNITMKVSALRMDAVAENVNALNTLRFAAKRRPVVGAGVHEVLDSGDTSDGACFLNQLRKY